MATAPEGLLHPGNPALGFATPPMSSAGEGVALGPPGPRSRSRLLRFPVIGPVWDRQGPRDQESEVGTEAESKVQGEQAQGGRIRDGVKGPGVGQALDKRGF